MVEVPDSVRALLWEVDWTTVKADFRHWVTGLLPPSAVTPGA